jgi:hypothetical protein
MTDAVFAKVGMGAQADRTAAKAYLALAQDSALAQKQALELERNASEMADLKQQIKDLAAMVESQNKGTLHVKSKG